jgi:hypothetical protein
VLCTVLLACAAGLVNASAPARASVVRVHGAIVASPAWAGASALVAVNAGKDIAVELINPESGAGGPISLTAQGEQVFPGESEHFALRVPDAGRRWWRRHPRANLTMRWGQHSHQRVRVPSS